MGVSIKEIKFYLNMKWAQQECKMEEPLPCLAPSRFVIFDILKLLAMSSYYHSVSFTKGGTLLILLVSVPHTVQECWQFRAKNCAIEVGVHPKKWFDHHME